MRQIGKGSALPAPFRSGAYTVRPEWIDYNGHLNLAYYVLLLDQATDALWDEIGLGHTLRAAGHGTFAAESHIFYRAELLEADTVVVDSQILGCDSKRLHIAHEMRRGEAVSAQQELMYLCVSLESRRVVPWPAPVMDRLGAASRDHARLPRPDWVGRRIAMPSPA